MSRKVGRLSCANATQQEHEARMGKEATNDNVEISFESLTPQL